MSVAAPEKTKEEMLEELREGYLRLKAEYAENKKAYPNGDLSELKDLLLIHKAQYFNEVVRQFGKCPKEWFLEVIEDLFIYIKESGLQRIKLNKGQKILLRAMWNQAARDKPIRIVLLKARQFGGSTLFCLLQYLFLRAFPARRSYVIAHETDTSGSLLSIMHVARQHDDIRVGKEFKDSIEVKETNGYLKYQSGYKDNLLRGQTIMGLHASEIAEWRSPDEAFLACNQAVALALLSMVLMESSAKGIGNYFHELWSGSDDGFERVFVGWHEHEEYQMGFEDDAVKDGVVADEITRADFEASLNDEETRLRVGYNLTLEQLHWRRFILKSKCGGSVDGFRQEYPMNPQEAFLNTGRAIFDGTTQEYIYDRVKAVEEHQRAEKGAYWVGHISITQRDPTHGKYNGAIHRNDAGNLRIYERPEPGAHYGIGVDVADGDGEFFEIEREGRETTKQKKAGDNSCIKVFRYGGDMARAWHLPIIAGMDCVKLPAYEVAQWYGRCSTEDLTYYVHFMANYYWGANIAIEANSYGSRIVNDIYSVFRYPRSRLYKRSTYDKTGKHDGMKLGWLTSSANRGTLTTDFEEAIRYSILVPMSMEFCKEITTYIESGKKHEAQAHYHDDAIMATAIAWQVVKPGGMNKTHRWQDKNKGWYTDDEWDNYKKLKTGESFNGMTKVKLR